MSFASLGLSQPLLNAARDQGYDIATPIQTQAIPAILKRNDLMASAQTGTGKTAGFVLPILERLSNQPKAESNQARVLILTPTRELAAQIHANVLDYGAYLNCRSAVVFGGVKINPQMMKCRGGLEILVATPGRLLDLYKQKAIRFDQLDTFVLDEADRMLDMGFIHDIKRIIALLPAKRQNLLFSATFSKEIVTLAKQFLNHPVEIKIAPEKTTAETVTQKIHPVDKGRKVALLSHLIRHHSWYQALVFARTKHGANKLVKQLDADGINAMAIHGNKSQAQRTKALDEFKQGKIQILIATDIAARGIDIDDLPIVVNFDLPNIPEDYVHRIGRTGRAGANGLALSLVSADESKQLKDIERLIKRQLPREEIDGFETSHHVPDSGQVVKHTPRKNSFSGVKSRNGFSENSSSKRRFNSSSSRRNSSSRAN